jgi:hypothetical protein
MDTSNVAARHTLQPPTLNTLVKRSKSSSDSAGDTLNFVVSTKNNPDFLTWRNVTPSTSCAESKTQRHKPRWQPRHTQQRQTPTYECRRRIAFPELHFAKEYFGGALWHITSVCATRTGKGAPRQRRNAAASKRQRTARVSSSIRRSVTSLTLFGDDGVAARRQNEELRVPATATRTHRNQN